MSHSSANNAEAMALRNWLAAEGWNDVFLDLDPDSGIAAGERWKSALTEAASRCEAVLLLISRAWLDSHWCLREFNLAHRLNKRLFGVLIQWLDPGDLPPDLSGTWQVVDLASGHDHREFAVTLPRTHRKCHVSFSEEGLRRLRAGLVKAGLDPRFFAWPPRTDPNRPPYRGLLPLQAEDAGIFFGRDSPIVEALDQLRGLRQAPPPRLFVILGASGAGKSSFLRAGLFARMARDDQTFLPLPIIRPERAAISGETGFLAALDAALAAANIAIPRARLRAAVDGGAPTLRPLLQALVDKTTAQIQDADASTKTPTPVISIDQGEELFLAEGQDEAQLLLALLEALVIRDEPALIVVIAIRLDSYAQLQEAKFLDGVGKVLFDLGPMPKGSYADVIKGPAARLEGSARPLKIEEALVDVLLGDIEAGGAKDALPLLGFTLERLYLENSGSGALTVAQYKALGGIKGSIEEAVERAFTMADSDPAIPNHRPARLALLRRGIIPWLAGVDPDTGAPRRRVARVSEIPAECRPLLQKLVEQRLLTTDIDKQTGEGTIEPAHEALLRQWGLVEGWLTEDAALLAVLDAVRRASREWRESGRSNAWLAHTADRLAAAERLSERPDLAAGLEPTDRDYLAACRKAESAARRRRRRALAAVYALLVAIIGGLIGWINQATIKDQINWYMRMRPYMVANYRPHRLTAASERALKPGDHFMECAKDCPEMIIIPPGQFTIGSPDNQPGRVNNEGPQHTVKIAKAFAVSEFDVTFDDWDACVSVGGCPQVFANFGHGRQPVINVTWDDAQRYVAWLAKMTGQPYRLLTESEWEYSARAATTTTYWWGDGLGHGNANCIGCGSQWDNRATSPVGSFKPNGFGLYDVSGDVWQWVQDCFHDSYNGAPADGSAWVSGDCSLRADRGGSWITKGDQNMRIAFRGSYSPASRNYSLGIRVARSLTQ
ncbi:MAG: SUMF1/EgtB/PvdO family nonheme iron enzyme [Mycobacterium sp.]|uniref:nSTAND1 domain-containing NTPase n=1 Tax=Mycobacterium sp. TaxID=1785 RepID=UPI003F988141